MACAQKKEIISTSISCSSTGVWQQNNKKKLQSLKRYNISRKQGFQVRRPFFSIKPGCVCMCIVRFFIHLYPPITNMITLI